MLLTEEQAREKWCPFVRMGQGGHNRWSDMAQETRDLELVGCECIASDCMAWRWEAKYKPYGYCGLAGKAET